MPLAVCLLSTSNLKESTVALIGMHAMGIPFSHHQWCHCMVRVLVKTFGKSPSLCNDQRAKPRIKKYQLVRVKRFDSFVMIIYKCSLSLEDKLV